MDGISLKQLRYFEAVARFGHFGRAAAHCGVSQPALSMQVQQLETRLGLALLERRPSGVQLTDAGEEVKQRARQVLIAVRDLGDYASSHRSVLTGKLRLGLIPTLAPYVLPQLMTALRRRHGELDLRVRESQTQTLVDELLEGELDVLVAALPIEHAELESSRVFVDRFVLAVPADGPDGVSALALLERGRVLLLEEGHCFREQALAVCGTRSAGADEALGATSLATLAQMVASGIGMTLLPEISLPIEARDPRLRLVPLGAPEPHRVIGLVWRRTSPRKRDFVALGPLLAEVVQSERETGEV